jgi:hypothetical protein
MKIKHYRSLVNIKDKYCYRLIKFKFSDLFVVCDKDIYDRLSQPLIDPFYDKIEAVIKELSIICEKLKTLRVSKRRISLRS